MTLADFDFELPPELIAQFPPPARTDARMLVLERATGRCELRTFPDILAYLRPGDCLVLNDTRVLPARLVARRENGGDAELLLVEELEPGVWSGLVRPGKRFRHGGTVTLVQAPAVQVRIEGALDEGLYKLRFPQPDVLALLEQAGTIPLPPYIEREATAADRERYQTVYARQPGAVAAPTAGLHFTPALLAAAAAQGVSVAHVTLHVGPGTFRPVKVENLDDHIMHEEVYHLLPEAAASINAARRNGGRVVAVGTTSVRVLETCAHAGEVVPGQGRTRLFLHPPKTPAVTDLLLTNFHLPRSTLLMLVATFTPREHLLAAYRLAVAERFRFFSYGDCMLLV